MIQITTLGALSGLSISIGLILRRVPPAYGMMIGALLGALIGLASPGAAAMMHSGATVLDHMPHGSFFHSTGGSVGMNIRERLKAVPYETLIGFSMALTSTAIYGIFQLA